MQSLHEENWTSNRPFSIHFANYQADAQLMEIAKRFEKIWKKKRFWAIICAETFYSNTALLEKTKISDRIHSHQQSLREG